MSKKHFIALADALRSARIFPDGGYDTTSLHFAYNRMIEAVAQVCSDSNPQFKRERWLAYLNGECGPNGGSVKKEAA